MKEFFGIGGYTRAPEGFMSWQHLVFVSSLMVLMVFFAISLGKKYKSCDDKKKNLPLLVSALTVDILEIIKIVLRCVEDKNPLAWVYVLPLFLCSIQLIVMPLAAFSSGRIREASLDFVLIFGVLGAVLGTYGAAQNYGCYPVLSFTNVNSGIQHALSGFAAIYIGVSGLISMKKKNMWITFSIMGAFAVMAYIANIFTDCNYMFLSRGDGTPYDILYNLVGGNQIIYPILVVALFVLYIFAFYYIYFYIQKKKGNPNTDN